MQYKLLGNTGLQVSTICLGTMTFGAETDETGAHDQLDRFVAAGVTTLVLEVLPGTVDPLAALLALAPRGR